MIDKKMLEHRELEEAIERIRYWIHHPLVLDEKEPPHVKDLKLNCVVQRLK